MKPLSTILTCLLASGLIVHAAEPAEVEMNGLASFFGIRQAIFVLPQVSEKNFTLSEGETKFGITLVSVNARLNEAVIENNGQRQVLHICGTPKLNYALAGSGGTRLMMGESNADGFSADTTGEPVDLTKIPGNPGFGTLPPIDPAVTQMARDAQNAAAANAAGPDPASKLKDQSSTDWYQASVIIERDRIATAAQVIAGQSMPLPRTPLTPAGTAPNLVDSVNGVYANHMADFMTHDWSVAQ